MPTPVPPHERSYRQTSASSATLHLSRADRHLYVIGKIGMLRVAGWTWRRATAQAGGRAWQITRRGIWPGSIQATDAAGDVIGEVSRSRLHHSATLRWSNRAVVLRLDGPCHHRHVLLGGDRILATIDGADVGKRPLTISITDTADTDPGLLLFAMYVVHALTQRCRSRVGIGPASADSMSSVGSDDGSLRTRTRT